MIGEQGMDIGRCRATRSHVEALVELLLPRPSTGAADDIHEREQKVAGDKPWRKRIPATPHNQCDTGKKAGEYRIIRDLQEPLR
jgi:hypothetical protein